MYCNSNPGETLELIRISKIIISLKLQLDFGFSISISVIWDYDLKWYLCGICNDCSILWMNQNLSWKSWLLSFYAQTSRTYLTPFVFVTQFFPHLISTRINSILIIRSHFIKITSGIFNKDESGRDFYSGWRIFRNRRTTLIYVDFAIWSKRPMTKEKAQKKNIISSCWSN